MNVRGRLLVSGLGQILPGYRHYCIVYIFFCCTFCPVTLLNSTFCPVTLLNSKFCPVTSLNSTFCYFTEFYVLPCYFMDSTFCPVTSLNSTFCLVILQILRFVLLLYWILRFVCEPQLSGTWYLSLALSCTLRKGCVRTLWIRAPYWERGGGSPPTVTKSVS
jgi:hypothetical protein